MRFYITVMKIAGENVLNGHENVQKCNILKVLKMYCEYIYHPGL